MKQLSIYFIIPLLLLLCNSCVTVPGWTTRYQEISSDRLSKFSCSTKNDLTEEQIIQIDIEDIKSCILSDTTKIIWLEFSHLACARSVGEEVAYYRKYQDKFELVIMNDDYDIELVKNEEKKIAHPIYFLDPSYRTLRTKNTRSFIEDLFDIKVDNEFGYSVFVYKGKIIHTTWEVDDSVMNHVIAAAGSD